jgi:hypothetical protein
MMSFADPAAVSEGTAADVSTPDLLQETTSIAARLTAAA